VTTAVFVSPKATVSVDEPAASAIEPTVSVEFVPVVFRTIVGECRRGQGDRGSIEDTVVVIVSRSVSIRKVEPG